MIVVTKVEPTGGAPLGAAPILTALNGEEARYTVAAAATKAGITKAHLRVILDRRAELFDCALYQAWSCGRWVRRLLSAKDVQTLEGLFSLTRVKPKDPITTRNRPA